MKLLNWLNDSEAPAFLDNSESPLSPALRDRLEELTRVPVSKIMVPRPLIAGLDADVQLRRVKRLKSSKTRYFPVYKGDLDHVLGWIEKAKVIEILNEGADDAQLERFLQPVARIGEKASAADLADAFLKAKSPVALVFNDQGQTAGLVMLPDFVELLFGFNVEGVPTTLPSDGALNPAKGYEI